MLDEGVQLRHFDREQIADLLAPDFDFVHFEDLGVNTMNGNSARGFQSLARKRGQDQRSVKEMPLESPT